jgi:DNA-binding IclR family transcriptional regulator
VAVAVPFFLGNDKVMGALAVFGPGVRADEEPVSVFATLLKVEAREHSQVLGQR